MLVYRDEDDDLQNIYGKKHKNVKTSSGSVGILRARGKCNMYHIHIK